MKNLISLAVLAAATIAPASANTLVSFEAELEYDKVLVQTRDGAVEVLESLEAQARQECRVTRAASRTRGVDDVCVLDMVHKAVNEIESDALTAVYADSPLFVEAAPRPVRVAQR